MGIVTLPDGITGPALQTTQIINAKWDKAQAWYEQATGFSQGTVAEVGTAPEITAPTVKQSFMSSSAPGNLSFEDAGSVMSYFDAKNSELSALIDRAFRQILGIAFPDMSLIASALGWCNRAITQGGTGISESVEAALWERGRARVLREAERDLASVQERYARSGWPLPPGAMLHEAALIRQGSRDKLAEASRDIAIKSFETEVENVRFAVKAAADQFSQAINAVGDYVKTVMLGPQIASQLASNVANLKNDASRTLVSLYQAQTAAMEPLARLAIADAEMQSRASEANLRAKVETAQLRAQVALAQVKMVGDAAAASLNGIGASVGNSMQSSVSMSV